MLEISKQKNVQILLVDDHPLMRLSMKNQFSLEQSFSVVGEASNGAQAVDLATQLQPDVVLMDIVMPVMDGITATQRIKSDRPTTRIIVLSAFDNDTHLMGMLTSGADGYCLKTMEWEQLITVIQLIAQGGAYLDPQIAQKVAWLLKIAPISYENPVSEEVQQLNLSNREREILKLIAAGHSDQEIADQLYLSLGNIKSYVRIILNKLSIDDRVLAATMAV